MIQDQLNLALIQFDPKWEDVEANLTYLSELMDKVPKKTDVVILPEAFATGFSIQATKVAQPMDGVVVCWMKEKAMEMKLAICGSVFVAEAGNFFNRFIWIHPEGEIETYDKRHLFSMGNETGNYSKGKKQLLIAYKGWKIFPQICYDLRFPVWSRNTENYDLLINVANWPASRRKVWKTLLKARAIENQCYVAAVNRVGNDGMQVEYSGDSMMIDFKGDVVLNAKDYTGILLHQIQKTSLIDFNNKFNTLKDADLFSIQL